MVGAVQPLSGARGRLLTERSLVVPARDCGRRRRLRRCGAAPMPSPLRSPSSLPSPLPTYAVLLAALAACAVPAPAARSAIDLFVLGIAQDGGVPQLGCDRPCCAAARAEGRA